MWVLKLANEHLELSEDGTTFYFISCLKATSAHVISTSVCWKPSTGVLWQMNTSILHNQDLKMSQLIFYCHNIRWWGLIEIRKLWVIFVFNFLLFEPLKNIQIWSFMGSEDY